MRKETLHMTTPIQITVATFESRRGNDETRLFAVAAQAEAWRQEIARDNWSAHMDEDRPSDAVELADRYFEAMSERGGAFFRSEELPLALPPAAPLLGVGDRLLAVSHDEFNTILAALRFWQRTGNTPDLAEHEIATDGDESKALGDGEIDELCERLNCSPAVPVEISALAETLGSVADTLEEAIDTHIYNEGEEPANAPERQLVAQARAVIAAAVGSTPAPAVG
jgi:hypothetical protein